MQCSPPVFQENEERRQLEARAERLKSTRLSSPLAKTGEPSMEPSTMPPGPSSQTSSKCTRELGKREASIVLPPFLIQ